MDNREIARELVKVAKEISSSRASKEYDRQSKSIEKSLNSIMSDWKKVKKSYENQLKENPDSWKGVGVGSELGTLVENSKELAEFLNMLAKG